MNNEKKREMMRVGDEENANTHKTLNMLDNFTCTHKSTLRKVQSN